MPLITIDDVQRVLAVAHDDDTAHRFALAVPLGNALSQVGTVRDDAQITHQHRSTIAGCNRDFLDVRQGPDITHSSHQVVGAGHFKHPPAYLVVAGPDFVDDGLQGNMQSQQAFRIQLDLILANESPDRGDLRDSRHSLQRIANLPVLQASQVGEIQVMAAINQQVFVDPTGSSGVGPDNRVDPGR